MISPFFCRDCLAACSTRPLSFRSRLFFFLTAVVITHLYFPRFFIAVASGSGCDCDHIHHLFLSCLGKGEKKQPVFVRAAYLRVRLRCYRRIFFSIALFGYILGLGLIFGRHFWDTRVITFLDLARFEEDDDDDDNDDSQQRVLAYEEEEATNTQCRNHNPNLFLPPSS